MEMDEELFEKLKKFIYEQGFGYTLPFPLLIRKKPITKEMSIERDLKVTGDDSDDFLIAFGKEFNVDVSHFRIGDYFQDERNKILPGIVRVITGKQDPIKKRLTVEHLLKAIEVGRLDDEVINS